MIDNTLSESKDLQDKRLVFEKEIHSIPLPFFEIILGNENVKDEVFKHFLSTPLKPSKYLFLQNHLEDEEIKAGIKEANEKLVDKTGFKNAIASSVSLTDFEIKVRDLNNKFYASISDGTLSDTYYSHSIGNTEVFKTLENIDNTIRDFNKLVLTKSEYSPAVYAEVFAKDITAKLEKIGLPKLTKAILTDFVEKMESMEIEAESRVWRNEYEFAQKFGVSVDGAKRKYRELKRYADNYLNQFCDKMKVSSENHRADKSNEKSFILSDASIIYERSIRITKNADSETAINTKQQLIYRSDIEKLPAKFFAFYHWILIDLGVRKDFQRNENDQYKKNLIEAYAVNNYFQNNGQSFYRAFIRFDLTDKTANAKSFGRGYKDKLIQISNNDAKVIAHLKDFPN